MYVKMRNTIATFLAIFSLLSVPAHAFGPFAPLSSILPHNNGAPAPLEISNDSGGFVAEYAIRMYTLRDAGRKVRFEGRCDSACTLFLALSSQQTCVSPGAYFRFHSPSAPTVASKEAVQAYLMRKYPGWVRHWISSQGGLSSDLITMDYSYASRFMRTCA